MRILEGGWFFKSKIGTNDIAGMTKMSSCLAISIQVDQILMELYYGFKENCGFWSVHFL